MFLEICGVTPLPIISSLGNDGQIRRASVHRKKGKRQWR